MADEHVYISYQGPHRITFSGLQESEVNLLQRMETGAVWVTVKKGRLQENPIYLKPPTPVEDPKVDPCWPALTKERSPINLEMFPVRYKNESPAFIVQHLCGYGYTPEKYTREVEKLESWGFDCLRSRRKDDGKFWEMWYLPGDWAAEGELKEHLDALPKSKNKTQEVVSFLCKNAHFGTLDLMLQRAASVIDGEAE